jgi:hypothetical protein
MGAAAVVRAACRIAQGGGLVGLLGILLGETHFGVGVTGVLLLLHSSLPVSRPLAGNPDFTRVVL